jgi:hypothetical protein
MEAGLLFIIPLVVVIWLVARGLDSDRVKAYIESRGGRLLEKRWAPFGPGRFGEKSDRIYQVRYLDRDGNEHLAHCKTSMWTGVYFTEDRIANYAERPTGQRAASLEEENRRLREELKRLRGDEA